MEDDGKKKEQHTSIKSVPGGKTKNESEVSRHLKVIENKKNNTNGATKKKRPVKKISDPNWAYQIQTETGFVIFWAP